MTFQTLDHVDVQSKRVFVRVDFNVPISNGTVSDDTRIMRVKPTISELQAKGAKIILLSHFGRPKGKASSENSLQQIVKTVEKVLGHSVKFTDDCIGDAAKNAITSLKDGDILLLENTRFHAGEETNDPEFSKALAKNGDIYVNDAFSASHRAHASTEGIAHLLPAFAGRAMQLELESLEKGLGNPKHPVIAIVGGAKISSKIDLLNNLVEKVNALVIGGGMANTFLAAQGLKVGKSLCEHDLGDTARAILIKAQAHQCAIILPIDAVVASNFAANAPHQHYGTDAIPSEGMMLDIGAQSIERINAAIDEAQTVVWNGPLGAFELSPFDKGTVAVAQRVSERTKAGKLVSVAGGGDTVAALNHAHVSENFSYISTAGGAFLEWMEGKPLPGVLALNK